MIQNPVSALNKLQQEGTNMLVGECQSEALQDDSSAKQIEGRDSDAKVTRRDVVEYFQSLRQRGIGMNLVYYVGAAHVHEIDMVLVNVTVAVDHETSTGELAGEILRHSYPQTPQVK